MRMPAMMPAAVLVQRPDEGILELNRIVLDFALL
jgi:hypothetical protein